MEALKKIGEKAKGSVGSGIFDVLESVLGSIDAFDQIGELLKTVVPLKATVEVKGKPTLEVMANFNKSGELWVGFRRVGKVESVDGEDSEEHAETEH